MAEPACRQDFDDFYSSSAARLIRHGYALTGDLAEAQDIAQEAFARAWQRWPSVRDCDSPEAWVRRVATRVHNKLLKVTLGFKGTDTHGIKAFRRERLLSAIRACVVDKDVFASELVIRAYRQGLNVLEIPIQLREKRQPSVHLLRRVPNVLKNVAKLVYVIRVRGA